MEIGRAIAAAALKAARGAGLIGFDNAGTGLSSTNVQSAITEVNGKAGGSPATDTNLGAVKLSQAATDPANPVVPENNDPRLSDARTPTAHNHDDRYYTETESDARYKPIGELSGHAIQDEGAALSQRGTLDFVGTGVLVEDDSVNGKTKVNISGASAGAASETSAGITEQATEAEVQAGTAGNLFATVARLKAELDRRAALKADASQEAVTTPTLFSGWSNFGGGDQVVGYYKDSTGRVHLRGVIAGGTFGSGATLFTLPAAYRPAANERFSAVTAGTSVTGRVDVLSDGRVVPVAGSNTFLSLSGLSFRAGS